MPRSWKALPLATSKEVLLKAPTHREHLKQVEAGAGFKPPKNVAAEVMAAITMTDALDDEGVRLPQGATYVVYRYAQGLAVSLPSGYTVYVPLEGQKRGSPGAGETGDLEGDDQEGETPEESSERTA